MRFLTLGCDTKIFKFSSDQKYFNGGKSKTNNDLLHVRYFKGITVHYRSPYLIISIIREVIRFVNNVKFVHCASPTNVYHRLADVTETTLGLSLGSHGDARDSGNLLFDNQ